jgi:hypothetical protein
MLIATTSIATVAASTVEISVTLDADWTLPAFLGNAKTNGNGDALSPTVELLCVGLRYPAAAIPFVSDAALRAAVEGKTLVNTAQATFSGVGLKPKDGVGEPSFSFLPESTEPLYIGEWSLTIADYGLDVDADTYIDILIPDSHAYEFKQAAAAGETYEPTEAYYVPSQCSVNGLQVQDVTFPTYSSFAEPSASPLIVGASGSEYTKNMRLTVHIADAISKDGAATLLFAAPASATRCRWPPSLR